MNRRKHKTVAMALACILAVGMSAAPLSTAARVQSEVETVSYTESAARTKKYLYTESVSNKNTSAYNRKSVRIGNTALSVKGLTINGIEYIPFRAAANAIGASYNYNSRTKTSVMTAKGLTLSSGAGCYVSYANDRTLFSISPTVIMNDGRMYIPADIFAKAVGMKASKTSSELNISGSYSPLAAASNYYRADEVLWLARIIHAESSGESLLGQIAVGNVVLNRVKSPYYPNTIYGVIFDKKYGVQFSPVLNGTIYNTPSYNSTLAAKICLEGFDISDGAFFFLEPRLSTSSWIPETRTYAFTIGRHDFYK